MSTEIEDVKDIIETLVEYDQERLIERRDEWGAVTFEEIETEIDQMYSLFGVLQSSDLSWLPNDEITPIATTLSNIKALFEKIDEFSTASNNTENIQQEIYNTAIELTNSLKKTAGQHVSLLQGMSSSIDRDIKFVKKQKKEIETEATNIRQTFEKSTTELEQLKQEARRAAGEAAASSFTDHFDQESKHTKGAIVRWLWAAVVLWGMTLMAAGFAWWYMFDPSVSVTTPMLVAKMMVVAIIGWGAAFCSKQYRSEKHVATTYKHKALSLETLSAFVGSAKEQDVKDLVTLAGANAIFAPPTTGLVDQKTDGLNGVVTELFKLANK